ncbi:type III PLP-dependent enzyme domain-containing protein [Spelaeicoccus albus]|uniref:Diaminopimelate decarboxylase n=1 Tax=Spelaeicoccus albus TaxID=1280376 RepID=A0A7Z0D2W2_9MICO|nr:diaminopimelate decarboxylase [Spelaeicoccus albus]NYI67874.1 diaminopimelate decarboxylase [Spelaeicoccus albus]
MHTYAKRRDRAVAGVAATLSDESPVVGLIDLDLIDERAEELRNAFRNDQPVLHTIAAKAIPLGAVLAQCATRGMGCEVASPGELELALATGFSPENIVFDSPAKTVGDLRSALKLGVGINFDNFTEVARFDEILAQADALPENGMGLRINPQLAPGSITAMSTATKISKFGVGLADEGTREEIISTYLERSWMNQIHVHSGSQGMSLEQSATAVRVIVELANEINDRSVQLYGTRRVKRIDIGGGLPVNYYSDEVAPSYREYRLILEELVPELFDYELVTEFGRSLAAKSGSILSRVEYVKKTGGRRIATTHAGVQVVTRTAYMPNDWPLRVIALTADGERKTTPEELHDVAGPACFSGDLVAQATLLPRLDTGDTVLIPDTGAYCFTSHYSYNMLPRIPVLGYRQNGSELEYFQLRKLQTTEDVVAEAGPQEAPQIDPCSVRVGGAMASSN